jgi:acyl-CoA thioesterase FadM
VPRNGDYLSVRVQVGWGDCDPAGIVFYPRFYASMAAVSHLLARKMGIPRESMTRVGRSSLSLRHEIVRIESDATQTLVVRGHEDRVFIVHGQPGLQARQLTPRMRDTLARFVDAEAPVDGLQPS